MRRERGPSFGLYFLSSMKKGRCVLASRETCGSRHNAAGDLQPWALEADASEIAEERRTPVNNVNCGDIDRTAVAQCLRPWLNMAILRRWETTATDRARG